MISPRFRVSNSRLLLPAALAVFGSLGIVSGPAVCAEEPAPAAKRDDSAALTTPLAVAWKYTSSYSPSVSGAPILSGDTLYFASSNRIFALSTQTGALKWAYPSSEGLKTVITGSMAFSNGVLYFSAGDGLYAIDTAEGKLKWPRYSVRAGVATSPVVIGDRIYFGSSDSKIYALEAATGEPSEGVWSNAQSAGLSSGGDFIGDIVNVGDALYYVTSDQVLHSVNTANGQQRWGQRLNANLSNATPVISGEYLYLPAGNSVQVFRLSSGQFRWQARLGDSAAAPPVIDTDGTIYAIQSDRYMLAIGNSGRSYLWKKAPRLENETNIAPVIAGNLLLVGTSRGGVYAFDKSDGTLKWRFLLRPSGTSAAAVPLTANLSAKPLIDGNALYIFTDDGTLTAFRGDVADKLPPTVLPLTPSPGDELKGTPPFYIAALVTDDGSGLDLSTLTMKLDDKNVARKPVSEESASKPGFVFDEDTGLLQYTVDESTNGRNMTMADGVHTVVISVKDYMGNSAVKSWTFHVSEDAVKRSRRYGANSTPTPASGAPGPGGLGG